MDGIPENMTDEYRDMAIRLLTRQLWTEHATMDIFGRAIRLAPTWEDQVQTARFTSEEGSHTEKCARVLTALGADVDALLRKRGDSDIFFGIQEGGMTSWAQVTAFNMIGDRAGSRQISAYRNNSLPAWGEAMNEVLAEEAHHQHYGDVTAVRICNESVDARAEMQAFVDRFLPVDVAHAFGRLDAAANKYCLAVGLKTKDTATLHYEYFASLVPVMKKAGLSFPSFKAANVELAPRVTAEFGIA